MWLRLRSRTRAQRELHRVRGHALVPSARATRRWHSVQHASWRLGYWLRVLWALLRSAPPARQLGPRSALFDQEDIRKLNRSPRAHSHEQSLLPRRNHTRAGHDGASREEVSVCVRECDKFHEVLPRYGPGQALVLWATARAFLLWQLFDWDEARRHKVQGISL